jgi:DNA-binding GntR family transcriptional regulator
MVQAEGLIEILPNGRLKIPELSAEDYTQIHIMRIALESAAARLSVPKLGPDDLASLEGFMAQMSHYLTTDYLDRIHAPHQAFHQGLVAGAGPAILERINDLSGRASRYRWKFSDVLRPYWGARMVDHRAILDAAIAGDGEQVAVLLSNHYLDAELLVAETIGDPDGRERVKEMTLGSLAPTVRSAVEGLHATSGRPKSRRAKS